MHALCMCEDIGIMMSTQLNVTDIVDCIASRAQHNRRRTRHVFIDQESQHRSSSKQKFFIGDKLSRIVQRSLHILYAEVVFGDDFIDAHFPPASLAITVATGTRVPRITGLPKRTA